MRSSWTECLPTGWDPFDREHLSLVDRLGVLLSAVNAGDPRRACAATEEFLREAEAHFAHEERLMRANGYGQLARHKEAHDLFLADVVAHASQVATQGITSEFRRWATGRVLEWFRFHISANDVALGSFLVGRRRACQLREDGAAPAVPAAKGR